MGITISESQQLSAGVVQGGKLGKILNTPPEPKAQGIYCFGVAVEPLQELPTAPYQVPPEEAIAAETASAPGICGAKCTTVMLAL